MSGCLAFVLLFALHAPSSIPCCVEISENASIPFLSWLAPLRQFIGLGALLVFLLSKRLMEGEKERWGLFAPPFSNPKKGYFALFSFEDGREESEFI